MMPGALRQRAMRRKDLIPMWPERLALPLIAAPMTGVSTVELVVAACRNGVIGSFPTHSASPEELPRWLERIRYALADGPAAPVAANVVVHRSNPRRDADVEIPARRFARRQQQGTAPGGSPPHG